MLYYIFKLLISFIELKHFKPFQEVFLLVRRKNVSIFLDGKASTTVLQIKQMISGISKKPPEEQQLVFQKEHKILEDHRTLGDYGITSQTAKAQSPALLAVAYKKDGMEIFIICKHVPLLCQLSIFLSAVSYQQDKHSSLHC